MDTVLVRVILRNRTNRRYIYKYIYERERKSERGGGVGEESRGRDID